MTSTTCRGSTPPTAPPTSPTSPVTHHTTHRVDVAVVVVVNVSDCVFVSLFVSLVVSSDEKKLTCTFEQGMCFWRQQQDDDDGDWIRTSGSTFPLLTGPSADHTLGNSSGGSDVEDAMMSSYVMGLIHCHYQCGDIDLFVLDSGFYIVTSLSPGQWLKSFRIHSLPLTPPTQPMCLSFW